MKLKELNFYRRNNAEKFGDLFQDFNHAPDDVFSFIRRI